MSPAPAIRPFVVDVPDETLDRISSGVRDFRWYAWREPADAGDWRYGPPLAFMQSLCRYWIEGYDWRAQERRMNALPHTEMPRGGHFPFYEAPDLLIDDLRAFRGSLVA